MGREKLPIDREAITHQFRIGGYKGYVIVGLYPDGRPGEMFIYMRPPQARILAEVGGVVPDTDAGRMIIRIVKDAEDQIQELHSFVRGIMDQLALCVSILLQVGVPLSVIGEKFMWSRFPPAGVTDDQNVRIASSITDYIFRWLLARFPDSKGEKYEACTDGQETVSDQGPGEQGR